MFKVIVERPRRSCGESKGGPRRAQGIPMDEQPLAEGIRRRWTNRKYLNENLAPLRRFLGSRIGRHWNDVFSELCENICVDSAVQKHVRDHVWDFVALQVERVDGRIRYKPGERWIVRDGYDLRHDYFVDPETGILEAAPHMRPTWRRPIRPRLETCVSLSDARQLRCSNAIWYELELSALPWFGSHRDHWLRRNVDAWDAKKLKEMYGRLVYARAKRQLGRREIRRYRKKYPGVMERIETASARAGP
jgi:hypothetical protein